MCTYSWVRSSVQTVASASPAFRSMSMCTSRGVMSTSERSRPAPPFSQMRTPLTSTVTFSESYGATSGGTVPRELTMRPQFGSLPEMAHLSRLDAATARPHARAASSVVAPVTLTRMSWLAPSPSPMIWRASEAVALATSSLNSSGSGSMPDAPEASSSTVSLVDMQPSTSMRLNDISTPAFKAA